MLWAKSLSRVLATPWTVAPQAPLYMGILQARTLEGVAMPSSRGPSQPQVSHTADDFFFFLPSEPLFYTLLLLRALYICP